jgi:hypothetical protein
MYTGDDESPTLGGGHWKVYLRMYMGDDALYAEGEYLWKPSMNSMGGNRCYSGFETCFAPSTWNVTVGCWGANPISNHVFWAPF